MNDDYNDNHHYDYHYDDGNDHDNNCNNDNNNDNIFSFYFNITKIYPIGKERRFFAICVL